MPDCRVDLFCKIAHFPYSVKRYRILSGTASGNAVSTVSPSNIPSSPSRLTPTPAAQPPTLTPQQAAVCLLAALPSGSPDRMEFFSVRFVCRLWGYRVCGCNPPSLQARLSAPSLLQTFQPVQPSRACTPVIQLVPFVSNCHHSRSADSVIFLPAFPQV